MLIKKESLLNPAISDKDEKTEKKLYKEVKMQNPTPVMQKRLYSFVLFLLKNIK